MDSTVKLKTKRPKEISRGLEADKLKKNLRDLENLVEKLLFEIENGEDWCKELKRQVQMAKEEKMRKKEKTSIHQFLTIKS